jgi:SAM-dependent methyltransferase
MDRESWNTRYEGNELVWTAAPNQFLVAEVASLAPGRALDLGCGEGRNAVWLAEQGWDVTAVDFSDVGVAKGREMASKRGVEVTWIVEDLSRYIPAEQAFDLVIDFYIHIPPQTRNALLAKAAGAVSPGGTLLVVGHDRSNLEDGCGGPQEPDLLFNGDEIAGGLTGLEIVKSTLVTRSVETDDGLFEAIDTLVRAQRPLVSPEAIGTVPG